MTIQEMLADQLPPNLLANIPHAFDFVGDIAIVEIPKELEPYSAVIGEAILKTHRNIKTVLAKAGAVSGVFRLRGFKLIAGESKTETVQKEFGCQYYVDVAKAYFSPRLSHEHKRIALLVRENETVLDLFAGVGPFSILIAKTHKNVNVYAVDVNPSAIDHLKKNVRLNRVIEKVYPVLGDARRVVKEKFSHIADRVIMNLPETASEFVDVACQALKTDGGMIHFYSFTSDSDMVENVQRVFVQKVEASGRRVEAVQFKFVRETAPHEHQLVLDALVR
jgi:tRNA (guanine37-N1)-methyltransferase